MARRFCRICLKQLGTENFDKRGNGNLRHECKGCRRKSQRHLLQTNENRKLKKADYERNRSATPKIRCQNALSRAKWQAEMTGHEPASITVPELIQTISDTCKICGIKESTLDRRLCMDHCHKTGVFRGWICGKCNTILGLAGDSQGYLHSLCNYLD